MAKFKVGDLVELKSGGPTMTVATVIEEKNENLLLDRSYSLAENNYGKSAAFCKCTWFYNNKYEHEMFPEEMLDASSEETL